MALSTNHPISEVQISCHSASIGTSPVAAYLRVPFRGKLTTVGGVTGGTITTADCSVAVAINGTAVTAGTITMTVAAAAAGQNFTATPSGANLVNENDVVSFTPSGASGAAIPGSFYAVIARA